MTKRISLDGNWQLAFFPEAESPARHPDDLAACASQAILARVPGNVEIDLHRAEVIPEPFYASNIRRLRPYEFYEWWYTRESSRCPMVGASGWTPLRDAGSSSSPVLTRSRPSG